jgi:hypothetical protein
MQEAPHEATVIDRRARLMSSPNLSSATVIRGVIAFDGNQSRPAAGPPRSA